MKNTQILTRESSILSKSIYNYFFAVREMIENSKNLKKMLSEKTSMELNRVCDFRSKLIVHKQGQKVFTGSALKYNTEDLYVPLQIGQYIQTTEYAYNKCKSLYDKSQKKFPIEDQKQDNYYDMANVIYKNLHLVPNNLKKEAKDFIENYGVSSDHPYVLGLLLKNLLTEYLEFQKNF